ncbi:TerD family protein [Nocardia sp. NPDC051832]|uniref:TerD family protein n=1 Tax=Nocardia sp. NPDC051832 TaxID=3155673 RepID=UPI00342FF524
MSTSLQPGQQVILDGTALTPLRVGLGWDSTDTEEVLLARTRTIDLDLGCLLLDRSGSVVDTATSAHLRSKDGSVTHSGDNMTGAGAGDDEVITVDLTTLHPAVTHLAFTVVSITGQNFAHIDNAYCRVTTETDQEIARFDLTETGGTHTAQFTASLTRAGSDFALKSHGVHTDARTHDELIPTVVSQLLD